MLYAARADRIAGFDKNSIEVEKIHSHITSVPELISFCWILFKKQSYYAV
jgi:hypothetical protein